ncbi:MAG: LuxR family transcriptional regulator [Chloroflexales bacterium]|nr:LuxR family transcriptional regulator [Chloroflexales bacterium]
MREQRVTTVVGAAVGATQPFVRTKLAPPHLLPGTLRRPRLTERLGEALRRRLVLISAPAGYGKTSLLADWLAEAQGAEGGARAMAPPAEGSEPGDGQPPALRSKTSRLAWITLDGADNDPRVLLTYVRAALKALGGTPLPPGLPFESPAAETESFIADMLNDLAELPTETVIILDDYHLIVEPAIHKAVAFLVDHLPPRSHLVLVTRSDPPLALARLRARGHMAELRAVDLRFSNEESAAYLLETVGLSLTRDQLALLVERTEGWAAGLQLTATALRDRPDQAAYVEGLVGSHRYIVDYLIEDVYERLPPHIQSFLLQTSILSRLCGPLCDAVVGMTAERRLPSAEAYPAAVSDQRSTVDSYSRLILETLERDNIFLVPLDAERQWFRYHHLFSEVLYDRLRAGTPPEQMAALHRRASAWFAAHGLVNLAVGHALQAGAVNDVVAIIEPVGLAMATRVGEATLRTWLPAIPDETVRARPRLALLRAWLCLADYDEAGAGEWLQLAETALARVAAGEAEGIGNVTNLRGEICAVRARLATLAGDAPTVISSAGEALQLLQSDNLALRTRVAKDLGYAYMVMGDLARAERAFAEAMVGGFVAGYPYISFMAATDYAFIQCLRGQPRAGAAACRDIIGHATRRGDLQSPGAGLPFLALADISRERHEFAGALPALAEAGARITPSNTTSFLSLLIVEARVARAQGDMPGALASARRARFIAQQRGLAWASAVLDALEAQVLIAIGDLDGATKLLERAEAGHEPAEFRYFPPAVVFAAEHCLVAPSQLRLGRALGVPEALRELAADLEDQIASVDVAGPFWPQVKLRAIQAIALAGAGREQAALAVLRRALSMAAPEGFVRVFAEEGQPLAMLLALLADGAPDDVAVAHARRILDAMALVVPSAAPRSAEQAEADTPGPAVALPEPVSARELDVLRLMADGQSNTEIADHLVIAVSTVKSHINSIFGKLGVATRTQAIARARRLGLI